MQNRKRDTDVHSRLLDSVGEGVGGMFWENSWNKYTIKGETDHQPRLDAWDKYLGLVHWESQRDRVEREVGGGIRMGNTCKSMANSCQYMTKNSIVK